ncbi:MAG: HD-GYP domain-containing protein [Phycisphaerae bacterium]|nr:HD-GYP domain-containing protein [Phycisphaerae bacterium]
MESYCHPRQETLNGPGMMQVAASCAGGPKQSLTIVRPDEPSAAVPLHCLRTCLNGDPSSLHKAGCAWLRSTRSGSADSTLLRNGKCDKGYLADAEPVTLHGRHVLLLSVDGTIPPEMARPADIEERVENTSDMAVRLARAVEDSERLAEEVLQNYEQLSLLFDFTSQIAEVTEPEQIERLLMNRMARLLNVETLEVVSSRGETHVLDVADGTTTARHWRDEPDAQYTAFAEQALLTHSVTVKSANDRSYLLCPLPRLQDQHDVVVVSRPSGAPEFISGDLQMVGSLLTFGGNLINNSELHGHLRQMSIEATRALVSAIDKKDHYTSGHSERVGFMSRMTGEALGVTVDQLDHLEWSGLLHDIGKIGVAEDILNKPGKLTDVEFDQIKAHPRMGYEILKPIESLQPILAGVLHHHENADGSGYPDGLELKDTPLFARIIHVADVFDALSSTRSYRKAFSVERSIEIIQEMAGAKLDAEITATFTAALHGLRESRPEEFASMFPIALEEELV